MPVSLDTSPLDPRNYESQIPNQRSFHVPDQVLPPGSLVVRGGPRDDVDVWVENAAMTRSRLFQFGLDRYGVSVFAGDASVEVLTSALPIRPAEVCLTTIEALGGFTVQRTGRRPYHATVWLPNIERDTLIRLMECFGESVAAPMGG